MRADLIKYWRVIIGETDDGLSVMIELLKCDCTRIHPWKLQVACYQTDNIKCSFATRHVGLWNSLPANVVLSPGLSKFESGLLSAITNVLFRKFKFASQ